MPTLLFFIDVSDRKNKLRFMVALRLQPLTAIDFVSCADI